MAETPPTINWPGKSGTSYTYYMLPIGANLKSSPGNYIFAKEVTPGSWLPIYVGETENLSDRHSNHERRDDAIRHGATHIHAHTTEGGKTSRISEELDLLRRWNTPCNIKHNG